MATDHELALYVMTGCPYCIKVKRFLADNGVTIPERNISGWYPQLITYGRR